MHSRSFLSVGSWVAICLGVWVVAWVVAESIPVFNDLLSLIVSFEHYALDGEYLLIQRSQSALFGSWFSCKTNTLSHYWEFLEPEQMLTYI